MVWFRPCGSAQFIPSNEMQRYSVSPYVLSGSVFHHPSKQSAVSFCHNVYYRYLLNKTVDEQVIGIAKIRTLRVPGV